MKIAELFKATPFTKPSNPLNEGSCGGQCGGLRKPKKAKQVEDEEYQFLDPNVSPNANDKYGTYYIKHDKRGNVIAGWKRITPDELPLYYEPIDLERARVIWDGLEEFRKSRS